MSKKYCVEKRAKWSFSGIQHPGGTGLVLYEDKGEVLHCNTGGKSSAVRQEHHQSYPLESFDGNRVMVSCEEGLYKKSRQGRILSQDTYKMSLIIV